MTATRNSEPKPPLDGELLCECRHDPYQHRGARRLCRAPDSYGCRCACDGYTEMSDGDDGGDPFPPPSATVTGGHVAYVIAAGVGRDTPGRTPYDPMGDRR